MVEVSPFKGIMYNKEKISKLDDVMSPPYDIISSEMQDMLYDKDPNNFVRLILGKDSKNDNEKSNKYTRAREQFSLWLNESILKGSDEPAIFPYKIDYEIKKQKKTMNGFFILLKLDPEYKFVKAHERTLSKPKADRLNLMREMHGNLEPIQLLYIDEKNVLMKEIDSKIGEPEINVKGYDGFTHKLWKLENSDTITNIVENLKDKILFIADGHHRYQTAINYADEIKQKTGETDSNSACNYRLVILANMFDEGLSILPTHRFIKMDNINIDELIKKLEEYFSVEENIINLNEKNYSELSKEIKRSIETETEHKFVLYSKEKYYVLTLKDEDIMGKFASDHSKIWRTLDVSILHKIILENIIGINESNLEDHVKYTRIDEEALKLVDEGRYNLSFLMNATKIDELKAVADAGEHMPQKSTYFLPKMLSGLVMYKME